MAKVPSIIVLVILSITGSVKSQSFEVHSYLIKTKKAEKHAKKYNFNRNVLEADTNKYVKIEQNYPKATYNSSIIMLFTTDTIGSKSHRARGYSDQAIVYNEGTLEPIDTLKVLKKGIGAYRYSLISLADIHNKIVTDTKVRVVVSSDAGTLNLNIVYNFFPGTDEPSTVDKWYQAYEEDDNKGVYYYSQGMVRNLRDPMYLTLIPQFFNFKNPYPQEPVYDFYIMEGNFSMPFTLVQGRNDQSNFYRSSSVSVDPEFTWRITSRESAPLLPLNTKVGLSYHYSHLKKELRKEGNLTTIIEQDSSFKLKSTSYSFQLQHYSNGQDGNPLKYDSILMDSIPNLLTGNFSLNSLKFRVMRNRLDSNRSQFSWGGFAQWHTPFGYEEKQDNKYGKVRLSGTALYSKFSRRRGFEFNKHHSGNGEVVQTPSVTKNTIRAELFFDVPGGDYFGYTKNPFRYGGLKLRYLNEPVHNRSLGWFSQLYYGRDYLNIRYSMVTFSVMIGFTFQFHKDHMEETFMKKYLGRIYQKYETETKNYGWFRW